jgi:2-polyprenyl-6-methoxyphenol hydroxylase-like FAD-dependent oxidoreductase
MITSFPRTISGYGESSTIADTQAESAAKSADVVFCGAGPTGLFCAIQAKLRNPSLNIAMLEKNCEYKRKFTLQLTSNAFEGMKHDARLDGMLTKLLAVPSFSKFSGKKHVSLVELENGLKEVAKEKGISILHRQVNEEVLEHLQEDFPRARIFIGSDGSHSIVREIIFREAKVENRKPLQHLLQAKFSVDSNRKLGYLLQDRARSSAKTYCQEHVGAKSTPEGDNLVTVNFFCTQKEYDAFKKGGYSFANPLHMSCKSKGKEEEGIREAKNRVAEWLKCRAKTYPDEKITSEVQLTITELSSYSAKKVVSCKLLHGRLSIWTLVGDAALGVPFFRSLHSGFQCAAKLGKAIARSELGERVNPLVEPFKRYEKIFAKKAFWELFYARIKSLAVSFLSLWYRFCGSIKMLFDKLNFGLLLHPGCRVVSLP